eukprot:1154061-Pelagomonas_calceolata.AAC.1
MVCSLCLENAVIGHELLTPSLPAGKAARLPSNQTLQQIKHMKKLGCVFAANRVHICFGSAKTKVVMGSSASTHVRQGYIAISAYKGSYTAETQRPVTRPGKTILNPQKAPGLQGVGLQPEILADRLLKDCFLGLEKGRWLQVRGSLPAREGRVPYKGVEQKPVMQASPLLSRGLYMNKMNAAISDVF